MSKIDNLELISIKEEYTGLIKGLKKTTYFDELTNIKIMHFIDEVKLFWLKNIQTTTLILRQMNKKHDNFVLAGAINLGVSSNDYYQFSLMGDKQFLYDPFLKLESFFRNDFSYISKKSSISYFKEIYDDTLKILTDMKDIFTILPVNMIYNNLGYNHQQVINELFFKLLSNELGCQISSENDFYEKYGSYSKLNNDLSENIKQHIIFLDTSERELPLETRINNFFNYGFNEDSSIMDLDYVHKIFLAVFTKFAQVTDILLTCSELHLTPFIRDKVTMFNLLAFFGNFQEFAEVNLLLKKSLIAFMFFHSSKNDNSDILEFEHYYEKYNKIAIIDEVINRIGKIENLYEIKISLIADIIKDLFV